MSAKTRELDEEKGYALLDLVLVLGREGGEGLGLGVPDRGKIHVQQTSENRDMSAHERVREGR
jgi:hypothetical protein